MPPTRHLYSGLPIAVVTDIGNWEGGTLFMQQNAPLEKPDGIIITVSAGMIGTNGYRHWLTNFLWAMSQDDWVYWLKQGNAPKQTDMLYVYILIGGKIRFRANFVGAEGPGEKEFSDGRRMFGKAWVNIAGPVVKAPNPIRRKGFQGFRYTQKLF